MLHLSLFIFLVGCSGCGGVKNGSQETILLNSDTSTYISNNDKAIIDTTSQVWLDQHYYRDTKIPLPDSLKNKPGLGVNYYHSFSIPQIDKSKWPIKEIKGDWNNPLHDKYNVYTQTLEFKDTKSGKLLKSIDVVDENPFHKKGFKRRVEPGSPDVNYFLMKKGTETKHELKEFLPKEVFHEIPNDFTFERAIAEVDTRTTLGKYAAVRYQLNWLPDAYSDEGEWNGPGYCVNHIEVYDSLGNKIFSQLFDGYSQGFSVSEDGMYLFNMSCLSPEWDTNIRYRFTVTNIKTKKVAYQELIENCKLHGGGGEFYPQFYNSNGSQIELTNNHIVGFTYRDNKFFRYLNELKFEIHSFSQNEEKLIYPDGKIKIVKIDSLYQTIKLN